MSFVLALISSQLKEEDSQRSEVGWMLYRRRACFIALRLRRQREKVLWKDSGGPFATEMYHDDTRGSVSLTSHSSPESGFDHHPKYTLLPNAVSDMDFICDLRVKSQFRRKI